ncbi:MAG: DNA polymerase III subunit delta [Bacteroidales bacterium]|nr:DNA polymerase III subunit delta [Bacteroidales bacterium]
MAVKKETLSYIEICNDIAKGIFAPIYVLMGEESFYIDQIEDMIVSKALSNDEKAFNLTIAYGLDTDIHAIINSCRRYPVMSNYQVVILREAQNSSDIDLLSKYAEKPLDSTILIICHKHSNLKAGEFTKTLKAKNSGIIFESKKINENNVGQIITDYVNSKNAKIDTKATAMLKDFVGTDLARIFGELDKLLLILPTNNKHITPEIIERNIGISKDFNNFELENALRVKNALKANQIINYFEKNPKNNPPVVTVAILFSFFSSLLLARTAKVKTEQGIMDAIGTKSSYRAKIFIEAMKYYSTAGCVNIIGYLREFDTKSKGINSRQDQYQLLRELIYKILHS